ncbi:MAG: hypothetical protein ACRC3Z_11065 [Phocaeicola sp.]
MIPTHRELMDELLELERKHPARFKQLWDSSYLALISIPIGGRLDIRESFTERAIEPFRKIAMVFMIEHSRRYGLFDDYIFSDDYNYVIRMGCVVSPDWEKRYKSRFPQFITT